jgi:hypothetical protein
MITATETKCFPLCYRRVIFHPAPVSFATAELPALLSCHDALRYKTFLFNEEEVTTTESSQFA